MNINSQRKTYHYRHVDVRLLRRTPISFYNFSVTREILNAVLKIQDVKCYVSTNSIQWRCLDFGHSSFYFAVFQHSYSFSLQPIKLLKLKKLKSMTLSLRHRLYDQDLINFQRTWRSGRKPPGEWRYRSWVRSLCQKI